MPKRLTKEIKMQRCRDKMDSAAKCASHCRARKRVWSCNECDEESACDYQTRYNNAHRQLQELLESNENDKTVLIPKEKE